MKTEASPDCTRRYPYPQSYLELLQMSVGEVTYYAEVVTIVHAPETYIFLTEHFVQTC
jgi:hypothetical protein